MATPGAHPEEQGLHGYGFFIDEKSAATSDRVSLYGSREGQNGCSGPAEHRLAENQRWNLAIRGGQVYIEGATRSQNGNSG